MKFLKHMMQSERATYDPGMSRRSFLIVTGGATAGLVVGFGLPVAGASAAEGDGTALAPLLVLLKAQRGDLKVQLDGCTALAGRAATSAGAALAVARAGGAKAVLFAMRGHIRRAEVQAVATDAQ